MTDTDRVRRRALARHTTFTGPGADWGGHYIISEQELDALEQAVEHKEDAHEALRSMIEVFDAHNKWCGNLASAPGWPWSEPVRAAREVLRELDGPEETDGPEIVANVDKHGVWTMRPDDEVPVLRYPTAEDGKTITVSPDPSLYEFAHRGGERAILDDCNLKKDCPGTMHLKGCKSQKKRMRRLGGE